MINLISTSDLLRVISTAAVDIDVRADFMEAALSSGIIQNDSFKPLNQHTKITTATTTTVLSAPGSNVVRNLKRLVIRNIHASSAQTVTLESVNATNSIAEFKITLAAGESLVYNDTGTLFVYDTSGGVKSAGLAAASDTAIGLVRFATQAEQETGTDATLVVTSGRQHFHPSAVKCWGKLGVTGNILSSYNVSSITDTGTGDVAVTINNDFSGADAYSVTMAVQRINSTAAEANSRIGTLKTASMAAGSFSMDCWDTTATTNVIKDPTSWHFQACGDL